MYWKIVIESVVTIGSIWEQRVFIVDAPSKEEAEKHIGSAAITSTILSSEPYEYPKQS